MSEGWSNIVVRILIWHNMYHLASYVYMSYEQVAKISYGKETSPCVGPTYVCVIYWQLSSYTVVY